MTDFYVSGIRKDKATGHIQQVQVIKNGSSKRLTTDREFVANLITIGRTTFQTIFWDKDQWRYGAMIHVIDDLFISTDANALVQDNLDSLPHF
ncbi:hypothetical protein AEQ67_18575 [Pseudomonas sp. RIT-PI-q]|uniref:hypothetical protein n=1 Tax=Pseudomonas sp. RIT-PI-q TaxID=1690247 RepID=UPI0006CC806F|nr:hypothetical protein [Pseudomonas sp. RIT-PI-q]KPG95950.1 hypothetical protein AEQ67_18575 [Pseudomonas sp. RIT-PI-q]